MAIVIEAPNDLYSLENIKNKNLFLAGGITDCPSWREEVINKLKDISDLTIYNPKRKEFDLLNKKATEEQIIWEFMKLKEADIICFWFSRGSQNPISLYELGMWGNSRKTPLIIGIDSEYERKIDIEIQTKLSRPDIQIYYSIEDFTEAIQKKIKKFKKRKKT